MFPLRVPVTKNLLSIAHLVGRFLLSSLASFTTDTYRYVPPPSIDTNYSCIVWLVVYQNQDLYSVFWGIRLMTDESEDLATEEIASDRLSQFVENLADQGLTQVQIATRANLPPQYLSDIKRGRRPMTELVARRLGEEFDVNYQWLMGTSNIMERPTVKSGQTVKLPLLPFPIEGEPREHAAWNGAEVEIAGAAAGRVSSAKSPFILQFGHDDVKGRLRKGDLILISQALNDDAEIQVVGYRKKLFLARASGDGTWNRVAGDSELPANCPVKGHCVGIVWAALD